MTAVLAVQRHFRRLGVEPELEGNVDAGDGRVCGEQLRREPGSARGDGVTDRVDCLADIQCCSGYHNRLRYLARSRLLQPGSRVESR